MLLEQVVLNLLIVEKIAIGEGGPHFNVPTDRFCSAGRARYRHRALFAGQGEQDVYVGLLDALLKV
jgi:hypothetical protein